MLGALTAMPATAQPAPASTPRLLLSDLYAEVHRESPRAEAARALARAADERVRSAGLPPDPQIQLGFMNYALPELEPMPPLGMTQLQLMQMLPVGGKLGISRRIASAQAAAQGERARDVEWELRSDAAMAFYDLYRTDQQLGVARETLRLLQDIRHIAEAMYGVGEGRQTDVLRANVELARMVEDTIRMTTMRAEMSARLNALRDHEVDVAAGWPVLPVFPDSVPSLESLVTVAQTERAMVKAGEREVEAAQAGVKLARREIWPDLTLGLQYAQQRVTMPVTDPAMAPERKTERMGSLMIGATVPIFARSRQLRMREEMTAMQRMAEADLAAMRATTRSRVATAYASLVRARNLAALYERTVIPQAEATVTSALAAYRAGTVDFMTLLDDRMTANNYRQELFALEAEQGKAWADLEMLLGRELFDPNTVRGVAASGGQRR
jgi:outer membrane protein, heavy metal efflux system